MLHCPSPQHIHCQSSLALGNLVKELSNCLASERQQQIQCARQNTTVTEDVPATSSGPSSQEYSHPAEVFAHSEQTILQDTLNLCAALAAADAESNKLNVSYTDPASLNESPMSTSHSTVLRCQRLSEILCAWLGQQVILTPEAETALARRQQIKCGSKDSGAGIASLYALLTDIEALGGDAGTSFRVFSTEFGEDDGAGNTSSDGTEKDCLDQALSYTLHVFTISRAFDASFMSGSKHVPEQVCALSSSATNRQLFARRVAMPEEYVCRLVELRARVTYQAAWRHFLSAFQSSLGSSKNRKKNDQPGLGKRSEGDLLSLRQALRYALPEVFRSLVHSADACHVAASVLMSSVAAELEAKYVRPTLLDFAKSQGQEPAGQTAVNAAPYSLYVHPGITLSADPTRVTAGTGVCATTAIAEGELLSRESAAFWHSRTEATTAAEAKSQLLLDVIELCREAEAALPQCLSRLFSNTNVDNSVLCLLGGAPDMSSHVTRYMRLLSQLKSLRVPSPSASAQRMEEEGEGAEKRKEDELDTIQEVCNFISNKGNNNVLKLRSVDEFVIGMPTYPEVGSAGEADDDEWGVLGGIDCGSAFYIFTRLYSHSCAPNAMLVFPTRAGRAAGHCIDALFTGEACVVALRDINDGEEITITYTCLTPPVLALSRNEKTHILGFRCACQFCRDKTGLLEGIRCSECGLLVYQDEEQAEEETKPHSVSVGEELDDVATHEDDHDEDKHSEYSFYAKRKARPFQHAVDCSKCHIPWTPIQTRTAARLTDEMQKAEAPLASFSFQSKYDDRHETSTVDSDESVAESGVDTATSVIHRLLALDQASAHSLLSTHRLRLQLRLDALATSTVAASLTPRDSTNLLQLTADVLEDIELLLPPNHPFVTGLRAHYIFARGRHAAAAIESEELAEGVRHDDCCGAVRAEANVMRQPFVRDAVLRACVVKCFQEHYVQCVGWDTAMASASENAILSAFLQRFSTELSAAGIDELTSFTMLLSMVEASPLSDEDEAQGR